MDAYDAMKECPQCGGKLPRAALVCRHCGHSLIARPAVNEPKPVTAILLGLILGLALGLLGLAAVEINRYYECTICVYLVLTVLFLAVFSARGRYETPKPGQFLISLLITLVPIFGTIYALFYAGKHIARQRWSRTWIYVLLILVTVMNLILWSDLPNIRAQLPILPAATETPIPVTQLVSTPSQTMTVPPTQSPVSTLPPTLTQTPSGFNCTLWSELLKSQQGQKVCVFGEYIRHYQRDDGTYVLVFNEEPGTFQVWSFPKPMQQYLSQIEGKCVVVFGWLQTSGVRPIIILRTYDTLQACP